MKVTKATLITLMLLIMVTICSMSTVNAATHEITDITSYNSYFDSSGNIIGAINDEDTIKLGNISGGSSGIIFNIDKNVSITPITDDDKIWNASFSFRPGSSGSSMKGINLEWNTEVASGAPPTLITLSASHILIENCTIFLNRMNTALYSSFPIQITGTALENITLLSNTIERRGSSSVIVISNINGLNIINNTIISGNSTYVGGNIINVQGASSNLLIEGNYIEGTVNPFCFAIPLGTASNVTIRNNEITAAQQGITGSGENITIENNIVHGITGTGISVTGANAYITDNILYGNGNNVIGATGAGSIVADNTVPTSLLFIDDSNYNTYFDSNGNIISSMIIDGAILILDGILTNKDLIITKSVIIDGRNTGKIINGTIVLDGTNSAYSTITGLIIDNIDKDGISLTEGASYSRIYDNTILIHGSGALSGFSSLYGIIARGSTFENNITENVIQLSGNVPYIYGISIVPYNEDWSVAVYNSYNYIIKGNKITGNMNSDYVNGITINALINATITENYIDVSASKQVYGIIVEDASVYDWDFMLVGDSSEEIEIFNNTIKVNGPYVQGIQVSFVGYFDGSVLIEENNIHAEGESVYGVATYAATVIVNKNNITVIGGDYNSADPGGDVIPRGIAPVRLYGDMLNGPSKDGVVTNNEFRTNNETHNQGVQTGDSTESKDWTITNNQVTKPADYSVLSAYLDTLVESDYTPSSWALIASDYDDAVALVAVNDPDVAQNVIDANLTALQTLKSSLVPISTNNPSNTSIPNTNNTGTGNTGTGNTGTRNTGNTGYQGTSTTSSGTGTSKTGTVLTLNAPTIYQGKITAITATLKDANGKVLANQKVQITINKKNYTATTNSKGVATFKVKNLKVGKFSVAGKYNGNGNFLTSSASKTQTVKGIADLKITKIRKVGNSYRITIKNQGSITSGKTTLRVSSRSYNRVVSVNKIAIGKSVTVTVKFFRSLMTNRYTKTVAVNPNKAVVESNYKNNVYRFKA